MFHYFEAITNKAGDSLVGYFARVIDTSGNVVPIYSDNSGTPIITVSGVANMASTDDAGNASFYVAAGTYNLDIYAPDAATFILRVPNVGMSQGTDGAAASIVSVTANTLAPGASATATNTGTSLAAQFVFGIPAGTPGTNGTNGTNGADGTTGANWIGQGLPANNLGINGDTYTDTLTGLSYGQKTGGTWPRGATADVNSPWLSLDLTASAIYPSTLRPVVRAAPATAILTNLCYHDAPAATYQTFGPNVPITRAAGVLGEGTAAFATSRNVFLNSTAPVTQNCTVVVGVIIVWSNNDAGVTVTTAAGTAVGTGFGAVVPGSPQIITITTAGTISVTRSGSGTWYACQVEYNPNIPANSVATPLIITAGSAVTRDADSDSAAGALLSPFQSSTGTCLIEISRVERQSGYGRTPGILSVNNASYAYISNNTTIAHNGGLVTGAMGNQTWDGPQKWAFCWGSGTQSYGAGDRIPSAYATAFPFGTVTAIRFGAKDAVTTGQQALNGWIKRIKVRTDRITDRQLFDAYTATPVPTVAATAALLPGYVAGSAMPKLRAAVRLVKAGIRDAIIIEGCTSHTAGVYPTTAPRANSPTAKAAAQLSTLLSVSVRFAGWFGNNNSAPNTGASAYQPERLTFSAGWTAYGTQLGGASMKTSTSGAVITDTPPGITDTYTFYYWTFPGYGGWTLSDGTHTKVVAAETAYTASAAAGVMTVSAITSGYLQAADVLTGGTMPAGTTITGQLTGTPGSTGTYSISSQSTVASATIKSVGLRSVTLAPADGVVRGTNTFTMTSNDTSPKTACGGLERDSQVKSILMINGGTTLRTALVFATDNVNSGAAENSVLAVIRLLAPDAMRYEAVTNDASATSAQAAYTTAVLAAITAGQLTGDVVVAGSPPTATGTIAQATQDIYTALEYAAAAAKNCPIIDISGAMGTQAKWLAIGAYGQSTGYTDPTHLSGLGTVTGNGDIVGNSWADFIAANV